MFSTSSMSSASKHGNLESNSTLCQNEQNVMLKPMEKKTKT